MISICTYLEQVFEEFEEYIDTHPKLCELKKLHFDKANIPEYTDIHVQQLYLLRYGYAYGFEYKRMYQRLLDRYDYSDQIKVLSIGCGNIIDYWALVQALGLSSHCSILYRGLDIIDWNYKFGKRNSDQVVFERTNAAFWLTDKKLLNYDVFIFPKSISEFNERQFERICAVFRKKDIRKDIFHLLVSLRCEDENKKEDEARVQKLVQAIIDNNFEVRDDSNRTFKPMNANKGIRALDTSFLYPDNAFGLIKRLNELCCKYEQEGENCRIDCYERLTRNPTLRAKKIRYRVISFGRIKQ